MIATYSEYLGWPPVQAFLSVVLLEAREETWVPVLNFPGTAF